MKHFLLRNVNIFYCILFHQFMYRMLCTINMNINHSIKLNSHLQIHRVSIPSTFFFFFFRFFLGNSRTYKHWMENEVGKEKGITERWLPQSIQCARSNNSNVLPQFSSFFYTQCTCNAKPHEVAPNLTGMNVTMN